MIPRLLHFPRTAPTELLLTTNGDAAPTHLLDVVDIGNGRCDEAASWRFAAAATDAATEPVVVRESSLVVQWSAIPPG